LAAINIEIGDDGYFSRFVFKIGARGLSMQAQIRYCYDTSGKHPRECGGAP